MLKLAHGERPPVHHIEPFGTIFPSRQLEVPAETRRAFEIDRILTTRFPEDLGARSFRQWFGQCSRRKRFHPDEFEPANEIAEHLHLLAKTGVAAARVLCGINKRSVFMPGGKRVVEIV